MRNFFNSKVGIIMFDLAFVFLYLVFATIAIWHFVSIEGDGNWDLLMKILDITVVVSCVSSSIIIILLTVYEYRQIEFEEYG